MKEKPYNSLIKNERTRIKELSEQEDITTKADKGGAVQVLAQHAGDSLHPRYHLRKSRKRRLGRAMKSPPYCKNCLI